MTYAENALTFRCTGCQLFGILAQPQISSGRGVLIVVGGPQYRVGSHRQFVLLARALAAQGFDSLRFDCRGMGDSSGQVRGFEETGNDILAAARALRNSCPRVERVVAFGLCDGASAVLLAAERIERLAGLMLANPWVRRSESLNATVVRHYYRRRILSSQLWRSVLSGSTKIAPALKELGDRLRRYLVDSRRPLQRDYVDSMLQGWQRTPCPKLLVVSGQDLTAAEFENLVRRDSRWAEVTRHRQTRMVRLKDADHTFSSLPTRDEMEKACLEFMRSVE